MRWPATLAPAALWTSFSDALAQSCAMCRSSLAGQESNFAEAINLGILVLLIPPVAIGTGIVFLAFQQDHKEQGKGP